MPRSTIIIGNGLGMAINPSFFSLQKTIETVWKYNKLKICNNNNSLCINCLNKACVFHIIPYFLPDLKDFPSYENDLADIYNYIFSVDTLKRIPVEELALSDSYKVQLLTQDKLTLYDFFEFMIISIIDHYHFDINNIEYIDNRKDKFNDFTNSFFEYIRNSNSHLATLNYDNLLYSKMLEIKNPEEKILSGNNGYLIDGFSNKFNPKIFMRKLGKKENLSFYLHLHGSSLFSINDQEVVKTKFKNYKPPNSINHFVLSHTYLKPFIIEKSIVLNNYWKYLEVALEESKKITIFGYSGLDPHLNNIIRKFPNLPIYIIEWKDPEYANNERQIFWENEFRRDNIEINRLENILDFNDWK